VNACSIWIWSILYSFSETTRLQAVTFSGSRMTVIFLPQAYFCHGRRIRMPLIVPARCNHMIFMVSTSTSRLRACDVRVHVHVHNDDKQQLQAAQGENQKEVVSGVLAGLSFFIFAGFRSTSCCPQITAEHRYAV
jgi:hypothetical protein